jgi:hypothetical protein
MVHRPIDPLVQYEFERRIARLHPRGPRAICEYVLELSNRIGGRPAALRLLREFDERLAPALLRASGGDRLTPWPPRKVPK